MKIKYISGEKVYVEEKYKVFGWGEHWSEYDGRLQICKHRDIVRIINRLFKQAELSPENVPSELWSLLYGMSLHFGKQWKPHWEIIKKEEVFFDDPHKIRLKKEPKLHAERRIIPHAEKPYVIKGGLYKPTAPKLPDDGLSDDFRAFLHQERVRTDA